MKKLILIMARLLRILRGFIFFYAGLLAYGILVAGTGSGIDPNKLFPLAMFVGAITTVLILSYAMPQFLRKKWPEVTSMEEKHVDVAHTRFSLLRVTWILLGIAIVAGLSIASVSLTWY